MNGANRTVKARFWPWLSNDNPGQSPGVRAGSLRRAPSRTAPALLSVFWLQERGFGFDAQRPTPCPLRLSLCTLPTLYTLTACHATRYTLHPAPYTSHSTPQAHCTPSHLTTLLPTANTLHPTTYTLHSTPCTLHPTPYSILPTTYNPYPAPLTPHTLHPAPSETVSTCTSAAICFQVRALGVRAILEATRGQIDGVLNQLPCKCHQNRVASLGD